MDRSSSVAREFQRRRRATWRGIRFWLLLELLAVASFFALPKGSDSELTPGEILANLACLAAVFACLAVAVRVVMTRYRCPRCEAMPMKVAAAGGRTAFQLRARIDVDPQACAVCGARLRP